MPRIPLIGLAHRVAVSVWSLLVGVGLQYATLAKIPILIIFADHLNDAGKPFDAQWAKSSLCRRFASEVRTRGGDVTFWQLPELGIRGNTHMFMLEKNNRQIADLLLDWISTHVEHGSASDPRCNKPTMMTSRACWFNASSSSTPDTTTRALPGT